MRIWAFLIGITGWLCLCTASFAEDDAPVTLPGAVWAIVPPPDFAVVTGTLALFRHPSGAAILVQDSPRRPITRDEFNVDPAQAAQMRIDEVTEVTVGGNHGFVVVAFMPARNAKMMTLVVEGTQSNGNIIGVMPNNDDAAQLGPMRTALLSTVERPRDADDRLADLPYRISDVSGMHVFQEVPGSLVGLTDGPSDDIETASTQNFAMLVSTDMGGATYDPTGELGAMVQRLKQRYPDVSILSSEVIDGPGGKLGEIRYERTTKASNVIVGGVTWAKPLGSNVLVIVAQHPRGDDAAFARLVRLRDGIKPK